MAPRTDAESLRQAWRALSCNGGGEGWRTIPIELDAPCRLLAGRHCPGDEEAIIVGFRGVRLPPDAHLPQGHGFGVAKPSGDVPYPELVFAEVVMQHARLLEANVRSFLSVTGKVNRGIRDTLRDDPEKFMAYNNGIVLVADEIHLGKTDDGAPRNPLAEGHAGGERRPDDGIHLLHQEADSRD